MSTTEFLAAYDAVLAGWPVPVDTVDLASRYGSTRVTSCGPVDGPPLVLLHGGGTTGAVWFANVAGWSARRRVHAVDLLGQPGRSVPGEHPPGTVAELLDWLTGVLDALSPGTPVDLLGHSYGGWLALSYALRRPDRVRRLVLLDPSQCFTGYRPGYLLRALPLLVAPTPARWRAMVRWETAGTPLDPTWLELAEQAVRLGRQRVVVGRRPSRAALAGSTVPTLVLVAGRGRAHRPERQAAGATRLAGAQVRVVAGASHHTLPSVPAGEVTELVDRYLA